MPRIARKFTVDKKTGALLELTRLEDRPVLEQIESQTSQYRRDIFAEDSTPSQSTRKIASWPLVSVAAGVDAEDVPAAQKFLAERGIHTEFTPQGDPIFRSRSHRKAHCEAFGYVDRDAGYGDPQ